MKYVFKILYLFLFSLSISVMAQTFKSDFPVTNGTVYATAKDGSTIYLGGIFTYAGPNTGRGVVLDPLTGAYDPKFPKVNGPIYACASDSAGGWYIGGLFTKVGNEYRNRIAHINADGTVDPWNPDIYYINYQGKKVSGIIKSLAVSATSIYIGGTFDHVGDSARTYLAEIDRSSGIATSWNPSPDNGWPNAIILSKDGLVYVGGNFNSFQRQRFFRTEIASIDAKTGDITSWDPNISSMDLGTQVYGMLAYNDTTLYVWGNFASVDGAKRYNVAAIKTTTARTNYVYPWNPNQGNNNFYGIGTVYGLAVSGDTVYLGGTFTQIRTTPRNRLAAVSRTTGSVLAWDPNIEGPVYQTGELKNTGVYALALSGNRVYAGGNFATIGGETINNLTAIDKTTGVPDVWYPYPATDQTGQPAVQTIGLSNSSLYVGGSFTSVNGETRNKIAAFDEKTGKLLPWDPDIAGDKGPKSGDGGVLSLAISDSNLYISGFFETIGGQTRINLGAVNKTTGAVSDFMSVKSGTITLPATIFTMTVHKNILYAGGSFSAIGDSARNNLAAIDLSTNQVTGWNPPDIGTPHSILVVGNKVIVGGYLVNEGVSPGVMAIDAETGAILNTWNMNLMAGGGYVGFLELSGSTMYLGGEFSSVGGKQRQNVAAIDTTTWTVTNWAAPPIVGYNQNNQVYCVRAYDSTVYISGELIKVGGEQRFGIASLDAATGALKAWNPNLNSVSTILRSGKTLYLGGDFTLVNDDPASYFAAYTDETLTSVEKIYGSAVPERMSLSQNYPNPFNPTTVINYELPVNSDVSLKVYNLLGREVAALVNEKKEAGSYSIKWNATGFSSGVYFYRLQAGSFSVTKKLIVIK